MGLFDQSSFLLEGYGILEPFAPNMNEDLIPTFKKGKKKHTLHSIISTPHFFFPLTLIIIQTNCTSSIGEPSEFCATTSFNDISFSLFVLFESTQFRTVTQQGNSAVPVTMDWLVPGALVCIYTESFSGYCNRGNLLCIFIKLFVIIVV